MGASFSMNISIRAPAGACSRPSRKAGPGLASKTSMKPPPQARNSRAPPAPARRGGNGCIHRVAALREHSAAAAVASGLATVPSNREAGGRLRLNSTHPASSQRHNTKEGSAHGQPFKGGKVKKKAEAKGLKAAAGPAHGLHRRRPVAAVCSPRRADPPVARLGASPRRKTQRARSRKDGHCN